MKIQGVGGQGGQRYTEFISGLGGWAVWIFPGCDDPMRALRPYAGGAQRDQEFTRAAHTEAISCQPPGGHGLVALEVNRRDVAAEAAFGPKAAGRSGEALAQLAKGQNQ